MSSTRKTRERPSPNYNLLIEVAEAAMAVEDATEVVAAAEAVVAVGVAAAVEAFGGASVADGDIDITRRLVDTQERPIPSRVE
jgi:hypothetical protein